MFRAKARTWSSGASLYGCTIRIVRGKAVTARLLIESDVSIICRNERAEGLGTVLVFCTRASARSQSKTPSGDVWPTLNSERRLPWLAAMRLEVATWKSGLFWRQTDHGHSTCVLRRRRCSAEVIDCRHYVLCNCTDETSAATKHKTCACKSVCGECWPVVATSVQSRPFGSVPQQHCLCQGFLRKKTARGLAATAPLFELRLSFTEES